MAHGPAYEYPRATYDWWPKPSPFTWYYDPPKTPEPPKPIEVNLRITVTVETEPGGPGVAIRTEEV